MLGRIEECLVAVENVDVQTPRSNEELQEHNGASVF